jgi:hypothetical protein
VQFIMKKYIILKYIIISFIFHCFLFLWVFLFMDKEIINVTLRQFEFKSRLLKLATMSFDSHVNVLYNKDIQLILTNIFWFSTNIPLRAKCFSNSVRQEVCINNLTVLIQAKNRPPLFILYHYANLIDQIIRQRVCTASKLKADDNV